MKYPVLLFLSTLFFSCGNSSKSISFRIQNNLGEPVPRCYIGARYSKSANTWKTKSYQSTWRKIQDGEVTSYKKVKGSFLGYSRCMLEFIGTDRKGPYSIGQEKIDEAISLLKLELVSDSVPHPYKDEMITRDRLPYGKYTLVLEEFDPNRAQRVNIRIIKDK